MSAADTLQRPKHGLVESQTGHHALRPKTSFLRSLRYKGGSYHTRAGAGIVWDSDPERELLETEQKLAACRQAVALAEEAVS